MLLIELLRACKLSINEIYTSMYYHNNYLMYYSSNANKNIQSNIIVCISLTGVDLQSQEAYEIAASGLVRPTRTDAPVVYSIKCIDMSLPEFTLGGFLTFSSIFMFVNFDFYGNFNGSFSEICTINENEDLFLKLIMEVGYHLKNVATTVTMRCVRVGFFTVEHALLKKHWSLENIIENMRNCRHVIEQSDKFDLKIKKITEAEFPKPISDVEIIEDDAVDMKT